jgi:phospholipid/cholesterol/gamma-HCH transport system permease protein
VNFIEHIGSSAIKGTAEAGRLAMFFITVWKQMFKFPLYLRLIIKQCEHIGVNSLPIVLLTAFFTGGVLALQTYNGFDNATVAASQLGSVVALSILRELGPVLASLMVAGRVGAAIAAEIGTMKVTEQIDALVTLATNPVKYLVIPRVLACMMTLPLLVVVANIVGITGGYVVATDVLGLNAHTYMDSSFASVEMDDIMLGVVKAVVFGFIIGFMGCYHGYNTKGGAEGVGRATTVAVVYASVGILVSDYFITSWFMS